VALYLLSIKNYVSRRLRAVSHGGDIAAGGWKLRVRQKTVAWKSRFFQYEEWKKRLEKS
jgi:hypothetical protein